MVEDRAQLQTEAAVGGQQRITGDLRSHLAITQDEVRQDREHGFACGALDTPDGETTEPDTHIMGVACETPASATGGHMFELKAKGEDKGKDTLDKRLAIGKQTKIGGFVSKIDSDGTVSSRRFGRCAQCVTPLS